jgi:hypothetical protein
MVMRFYWGSAVGHTYANVQSSPEGHEDNSSSVSDASHCLVPDDVLEDDREIDAGDPELEHTLDNHDDDDWGDDVDGRMIGEDDLGEDDLHDSTADELFAPMSDT